MTTKSAHWASINEFSFVAGMRLMFWICKVFGRWPFRMILYPILFWYVISKPAARRASATYLQHVNALRPVDASIAGVFRHFGAFAEMMLDKMLLWSGLFDTSKVQYFGGEIMREAIQQKRGAVLICSHFGNLDLCRVLSGRHSELKLTILVHTKHAKMFNDMLATINPASQMNLMQVTEITPATAMILAERVGRGEFVVIAGDRIPVSEHPRVVLANFLGEPAPFPVGPYILSSVLQCPIIMLFALQQKQGYEIHCALLRDAVRLPRKARDQALQELAADYVQQLEQYCLSAPLQWFNFYDYWHMPEWKSTDADPHHHR